MRINILNIFFSSAQEQFVFPNNGSAVTTQYRIIVQTDNAHSSTALVIKIT